MTSIRTFALAGLAMAASVGCAAASVSQTMPVRANDFYGLYDNAAGASSWDMSRYDRSGTRGRLDLGSSPFHPEGPGNATD
jgi:hypothetical protein